MGWRLLVLALMLTGCILFWVMVVGCVLRGTDAPLMDQLHDQAARQRKAMPALTLQAMADATVAESDQPAHMRVVHAPSLPDVLGGLPVVLCQQRPIVGSVWVARWFSQYVPEYQKGQAVRPDQSAALLVTLKPPPMPQPIPGGNGGMLQVPPDYVLTPERLEHAPATMRPGRVFDFVQDKAGRTQLYVHWPRQMSGWRISMQLLLADDRVPAGCVPTAMLEMQVGSR